MADGAGDAPWHKVADLAGTLPAAVQTASAAAEQVRALLALRYARAAASHVSAARVSSR
jgi:hypothetical protein